MNTFRAHVALALALALCATPVPAQPPGAKIVNMTRPVAQFSQAEAVLADALRKTDSAATDRMLAADFEMRDGAAPNEPIPRAQWLASKHPDASAEQMAVHEYGDVAVVSFVNRSEKPAGATYVVDVWQRQGADWKLAVRYQSALDAGKSRRDTKPTGKN